MWKDGAHAQDISQADQLDRAERLSQFRRGAYASLTARADGLFELADAALCADGPVSSLVGLSLVGEHRRGHGGLYDALNRGGIDYARLGKVVAGLAVPRAGDGRIVLAIDVSNWLRPDAATSPDRRFCHTYGRGRGQAQMIPGWPYSIVAALETGASSWTALLDAVRLGPGDDDTGVAAGQLRAVVERLITAGHHQPGDPDIWIVADSGYDGARLSHLLADLPVRLLVRLRSDRVLCRPAAPPRPGTTGRPARHGPEFRLADPASWPEPEHVTSTDTRRYGAATARAWTRLHPRLAHRGPWADHPGPPPIIDGALIRLQVAHLPGDAAPKPLWLWYSRPGAIDAELVDALWQAFLRRFDLEHTFRFLKQTLGWTTPNLRSPQAADRWTWLMITAHTQLRLARDLTADLRRPWERPAAPARLTPARVRRGFRHLRPKIAQPASAPKPCRPGPGRPPGATNTQRAHRPEVGKKPKTTDTKPSRPNTPG